MKNRQRQSQKKKSKRRKKRKLAEEESVQYVKLLCARLPAIKNKLVVVLVEKKHLFQKYAAQL